MPKKKTHSSSNSNTTVQSPTAAAGPVLPQNSAWNKSLNTNVTQLQEFNIGDIEKPIKPHRINNALKGAIKGYEAIYNINPFKNNKKLMLAKKYNATFINRAINSGMQIPDGCVGTKTEHNDNCIRRPRNDAEIAFLEDLFDKNPREQDIATLGTSLDNLFTSDKGRRYKIYMRNSDLFPCTEANSRRIGTECDIYLRDTIKKINTIPNISARIKYASPIRSFPNHEFWKKDGFFDKFDNNAKKYENNKSEDIDYVPVNFGDDVKYAKIDSLAKAMSIYNTQLIDDSRKNDNKLPDHTEQVNSGIVRYGDNYKEEKSGIPVTWHDRDYYIVNDFATIKKNLQTIAQMKKKG